jgi:hypothetical protein
MTSSAIATNAIPFPTATPIAGTKPVTYFLSNAVNAPQNLMVVVRQLAWKRLHCRKKPRKSCAPKSLRKEMYFKKAESKEK